MIEHYEICCAALFTVSLIDPFSDVFRVSPHNAGIYCTFQRRLPASLTVVQPVILHLWYTHACFFMLVPHQSYPNLSTSTE